MCDVLSTCNAIVSPLLGINIGEDIDMSTWDWEFSRWSCKCGFTWHHDLDGIIDVLLEVRSSIGEPVGGPCDGIVGTLLGIMDIDGIIDGLLDVGNSVGVDVLGIWDV